MPSINSLPNELVAFVIDNLDSLGDVASLSRTNRRLYHAANPVLYKTAIARGNVWPLAFGARYGVAGTVKNIIAAGADPNFQFDEAKLIRDWEKMIMPRRAAPPPARIPLPPMRHPALDNDAWPLAAIGQTTQPDSLSLSSDSEIDSMDLDDLEIPHVDLGPLWDMGPEGGPWDFDALGDTEFTAYMDEDDEDDDSISDSDADSSTLGHSDRQRDVELWADRNFTALHLAARGGHDEVIEVLLENGASINSPSSRLCRCTRAVGLLNAMESPEHEAHLPRWTPLHMAICSSRPETAKLLLSRGADCKMEAEDEKGSSQQQQQQKYDSTALHHAAGLGQVELVKHLAEKGYQTDLEIRDRRSLTPLYYAYANNQWDSTMPLLLEMGADINVEIKFYQPYCSITPLGEAVRLGNFSVAQKLVDIGADSSHGFVATGAGHRKGLSPLHLGCMRSARKSGARPSGGFVDEDKAGERMSIMETFIAKGADIHSTDCNGDTPLISAATNRVLPSVRALIKAGADIHARNALGRTVVMQAVTGPPPQNQGIRPEERESTSDTARIMAEIVEELFSAGARIDDVDPQGNNMLHILLGSDHRVIGAMPGYLRILLNRPGAMALLTVKNKEGRTPFLVAFYNKQWIACDVIIRQQPVREAFSPAEIRKMFNFAVESGVSMAMDQVLDMDADRVILSDTALFDRLTAQCKWNLDSDDPAHTAIGAITRRGLPPLAPDVCTRLLRRALSATWWELAYQLISRGANVNAVEDDGNQTPLNLVIGLSVIYHSDVCAKILRVLLDRGADIHHSPCGSPPCRPLNRAININSPHFVSLMLARQALPLPTDSRARGGCYLHHAFRFAVHVTSRQVIDKLLSSGADIAELDNDDNYPASILIQTLIDQPYEVSGFHPILCSLLSRGGQAGVDINKPNKAGRSIASLLQTLLDNKHARNYIGSRLELVDVAGGQAIKFLAGQRTTMSLKLLKDLQEHPAGPIPAYVP